MCSPFAPLFEFGFLRGVGGLVWVSFIYLRRGGLYIFVLNLAFATIALYFLIVSSFELKIQYITKSVYIIK